MALLGPQQEEDLYSNLLKKRKQREAEQLQQDVGSAQSSYLGRGIQDSPTAELGLAALKKGSDERVSDYGTTLDLERLKRQQSLSDVESGRAYESGEAEKGRTFSAGEAEKARQADAAARERGYSEARDVAKTSERRDRQSDLYGGVSKLLLGSLGGRQLGEGEETPGQGGGGVGGLLGRLGGLGAIGKYGRGLLGKGTSTPGGLGAAGSLLAGGGLAYGGAKLGRFIGTQGRSESKGINRGQKAGNVLGGGLGYALGGPLGAGVGSLAGGAIGGSIAKIGQSKPAAAAKKIIKKICFEINTKIELENGFLKPIGDVQLGDTIKGGKVLSVRMAYASDMYRYLNTMVTGSHAVKENGEWKRVKNSELAVAVPGEFIVVSLITSNHRIFSYGNEFSDEAEWGDNGLWSEGEMDASLARLNWKEESKYQEVSHA